MLALFGGGEGFAVSVDTGNLQHTVRDEVLARPVALNDRLDQVLRYILIVCQQLLCVFRQAVSAIAEGGVVVVVADAGVKTDSFDDRSSLESLDFRIGVQFVEVGDAERKVGIHEQLCGFRLRVPHEERLDRILDGSLLEKSGKGVCGIFRLLIASDDDAGRVEVVVEGFAFPQKLRAEEDIVHARLFADVDRIANRDRGLDDDCRLVFPVGSCAFN